MISYDYLELTLPRGAHGKDTAILSVELEDPMCQVLIGLWGTNDGLYVTLTRKDVEQLMDFLREVLPEMEGS